MQELLVWIVENLGKNLTVISPLLAGGLEPGFEVPFSTIFHGIALEKR